MNTKQNRVIPLEEMKQLELNILSNFAEFCDSNNLEYSLCGGTLLGAIRHNGFIPWDDDIDVFVTRKTYNYICKYFNKWGKQKNLKLINYYNHNYYSTFAKIIDARTRATEDKRNEKIGVWIDLFIVDSMKSNNLEFSKPIINSLKEMRYFGSDDYFRKIKSLKDFLVVFKKWLVRLIKKPILRRNIERFIMNNPGDASVSYSFADQISWWQHYNKLDFSNRITLDFEGKKFKVISNWNEYLTKRYGPDYLIPPPQDQRENHQLTCCQWKRRFQSIVKK